MMFIAATGWQIEAKSVTVDYEQALMKSAKTQFGEGKMVGCLFHWKQAIRRRLLLIKLPENLISKFIGKGGPMEVLCVIPINEILTKVSLTCDQRQMRVRTRKNLVSFWNYFRLTWLTKYDPKTWNIPEIVSNEDEDMLVNRTNNACESFNRRLNEKIGHAHPTMQILIKILNEISCDYENKMTTIENSRKRSLSNHQDVYVPEVPHDYWIYRPID